MQRLIFILLILISGSVTAQQKESSLLWEIKGPDSKPSYLFGTMHIICRSDFNLSESLKQKIRSVGTLYGELDLNDPKIELQLISRMTMKDKALPDMLAADDYKRMSDTFRKYTNLPLEMFRNFMPFVPMSMMMTSLVNCPDKTQPETDFLELAKQAKIPMKGLETVEDQLDAIFSQSPDSMALQFRDMVLNFDSSRQAMRTLINIYLKGDISAIYDHMKEKGIGADFEEALLIKRNRNWIPVMEKAMAEGSCFFAVGAGHLGGTEGVINLLRQKGYQLTPLNL